jgi:hypothetical protein
MEVPCSSIFNAFPSDLGMCCSFNLKAADNIFYSSSYPKLIMELQAVDRNGSFENNTYPEFLKESGRAKTKPGDFSTCLL